MLPDDSHIHNQTLSLSQLQTSLLPRTSWRAGAEPPLRVGKIGKRGSRERKKWRRETRREKRWEKPTVSSPSLRNILATGLVTNLLGKNFRPSGPSIFNSILLRTTFRNVEKKFQRWDWIPFYIVATLALWVLSHFSRVLLDLFNHIPEDFLDAIFFFVATRLGQSIMEKK